MSIMIEQPREYMAYLVRIWPVRSKGMTRWRASLENAHTGECRGFASLDDLFDYLGSQAGAGMDSEEVKPVNQL
jgi:hypothetical protein